MVISTTLTPSKGPAISQCLLKKVWFFPVPENIGSSSDTSLGDGGRRPFVICWEQKKAMGSTHGLDIIFVHGRLSRPAHELRYFLDGVAEPGRPAAKAKLKESCLPEDVHHDCNPLFFLPK